LSILFVYLNFNKFPSSYFRVHWNARNSELGKMNSEIPTSFRAFWNAALLAYLRRYCTSMRKQRSAETSVIYIGWQWRNFFISTVFRHFVGQALRNVCCSDVSRRHFLNKIAIIRTFS